MTLDVDFFTFSRSDYATLRPIALKAQSDIEINTRIVAGGSHLLNEFGNSLSEIEKDFVNVTTLPFLGEKDDTRAEISEALALETQRLQEYFLDNRPDYVFIVGDRWEMLPVALIGSLMRIPVAHHSGGDITQGSEDNQTRYVLSTLSHLHFVALEEHKARLEAVGEESWRIFHTGEPALSQVNDYQDCYGEVMAGLGADPEAPFVLATLHPTSYEDLPYEHQVDVFIEVLESISHQVVLTGSNPDPGSVSFIERLKDFSENHDNVFFCENLGSNNYYSLLNRAMFLLGNSSSGIWEAPSFKTPAVNIGNRQRGRVRAANVLDCEMNPASIKDAITRLQSEEFKTALADCSNPYYREHGEDLILDKLKEFAESSRLLMKEFVDPLGELSG
jgi:UDP-hydrolysing UDP-N-acetyl-D-glucosamine 2-epimerase